MQYNLYDVPYTKNTLRYNKFKILFINIHNVLNSLI